MSTVDLDSTARAPSVLDLQVQRVRGAMVSLKPVVLLCFTILVVSIASTYWLMTFRAENALKSRMAGRPITPPEICAQLIGLPSCDEGMFTKLGPDGAKIPYELQFDAPAGKCYAAVIAPGFGVWDADGKHGEGEHLKCVSHAVFYNRYYVDKTNEPPIPTPAAPSN